MTAPRRKATPAYELTITDLSGALDTIVRHSPRPVSPERLGRLHLDGWAGRTEQTVEIVGETASRYRIRAIERTKLAGNRWLDSGAQALVPKHAIAIDAPAPVSPERQAHTDLIREEVEAEFGELSRTELDEFFAYEEDAP